MFTEFDLENWERKHLFHFFKAYNDPFFNITGNVDVSTLYSFCKKHDYSIFLTSIFCCTNAANLVQNFRLRIQNDKVIEYHKIDAGSTVLYEDQTFGFAYFDYEAEFSAFYNAAKPILDANLSGKSFSPRDNDINMLHFSVIPWVAFTSFKHARRHNTTDTIPKVVLGKIFDDNDKKMMPISVEVHHSLMDGLHVGLYFDQLQKVINDLDNSR
ncbi:MAG: CatA-like O-acetyltransferase [Bacteroidota bacterium]